jgi:hypothetical protein
MKRNLAALLTLGILCCLTLSCGERETKLFNGKDLEGWTFHLKADSDVPATDVFGVKDGVITIAGQPFGYMMTTVSYSDYKLHLEWRWPGEPSNSGIFIHAEPIDAVWPRCAEVNLMAGKAGDMIASGGSEFEELKETGGRWMTSPVAESAENPAGEWNTAEIICEGNHIQAYINGVLKNEVHFDRTSGPIALQSEGGPLEVRNVYITPIK